jgi:sulfide:quinone oxidoreductase
MNSEYELRPLRVVVVGGGVAAVETCLALRALAGERVEIAIVAPEPVLELKPAAVGEPFGVARVPRFDLARLAGDLGATLVNGTASAVEADQRRLLVDAWRPVDYDALVVAVGATPIGAVPGAITFAGPRDVPVVRELVRELAAGAAAARIVFAIPAETSWALPAYELALLSSAHLASRPGGPARIGIVTPEAAPLQVFGQEASLAVRRLLTDRDIAFHGLHTPLEVRGGILHTSPAGGVPADRVVALPRLRGTHIEGLPMDVDGFLPTDAHGRVAGLSDVYAAGDVTTFPIKQGLIATQQADAVAEAIAEDAGARLEPRPFRPQLRGLMLTGDGERYLAPDAEGGLDPEPEWWPPVKIPGKYLAPYLAGLASDGLRAGAGETPERGGAAPAGFPVGAGDFPCV